MTDTVTATNNSRAQEAEIPVVDRSLPFKQYWITVLLFRERSAEPRSTEGDFRYSDRRDTRPKLKVRIQTAI